MNELKIFNNKDFGEIRAINREGEPWFVGKDVAEKLGYKRATKAIQDKVDIEDKDYRVAIRDSIGRNQITPIINERGLISLIQKSKTKSKMCKNDFIKWLQNEGLIGNGTMVLESRDETEFLDKLEESLKPFNIKGIKQYNIFTYRIDYYIPELKIAIEYDENDHKQYTYEQQDLRQKQIEKELGCRFIRVSDSKTDAYNIGVVLKEIIKREVA